MTLQNGKRKDDAPCVVCGLQCDAIDFMYVVHGTVWKAAGLERGLCHLECLEA